MTIDKSESLNEEGTLGDPADGTPECDCADCGPSTGENPAEVSQGCGPGCDCGKTGPGGKRKAIITAAVLIVAAVLLARGLMTADEAAAGQDGESFGVVVTQDAEGTAPSTNAAKDAAQASLWGESLQSLADLDSAAASDDSVFVYLRAEQGEDEGIRNEIEAATLKAQAQGMAVGLFTLSEESEDYVALASQTPAPCVLTLVRGGGASVVYGDITEGKLLEALVAASRPSGCGPSGCGPSSTCE